MIDFVGDCRCATPRVRPDTSTVNPQVPGSSPGRGANQFKHLARNYPPGFLLSDVHVATMQLLYGNGRAGVHLPMHDRRRCNSSASFARTSARQARKHVSPRQMPCVRLFALTLDLPTSVRVPVDCSHGSRFSAWELPAADPGAKPSHARQSLHCVRVALHQANQQGGLRVRLGAALLPVFKRAGIGAQVSRQQPTG